VVPDGTDRDVFEAAELAAPVSVELWAKQAAESKIAARNEILFRFTRTSFEGGRRDSSPKPTKIHR